MTRPAFVVLALLAGSARVVVAQNVGSIVGTVRDTTGLPLAGAEVTLVGRSLLTGSQGTFRFDSLPVGTHFIAIRRVGYTALRTRAAVRPGVQEYNYVLQAVPQVLSTVIVEARRAGIYGTVGDTALRPLAGVKIQLAGRGGGEALTDSTGSFSFPGSGEGQYAVRVVHPGYAEERLFAELRKGEGVELAFRLRPSRAIATRQAEVAVQELGRRLVTNLAADRLSAGQLERYGSLGLCDLPGFGTRLKSPPEGITIILNGTDVLENMPVGALCSWRASEVELVEFGYTVCRDATRTLVDLLGVWCTRFNEQRGMSAAERRSAARDGSSGGGRIRTQKQGGPFVVIWERQ